MTAHTSPGRITYRGVVTQWHCDHVGHLNIAHYVSRFDEAHWAFFGDVGLGADWLRANRRGMAAVEQHLRYHKEVRAGDTVTIRSRLVEVRAKVIVSTHEMVNDATGERCASERIACALVDTDARRAAVFPDELLPGLHARLAEDAPTP